MIVLMLELLFQNNIVLNLHCLSVEWILFCEILEVEPIKWKFYIILFISSIALIGVLATLDTNV